MIYKSDEIAKTSPNTIRQLFQTFIILVSFLVAIVIMILGYRVYTTYDRADRLEESGLLWQETFDFDRSLLREMQAAVDINVNGYEALSGNQIEKWQKITNQNRVNYANTLHLIKELIDEHGQARFLPPRQALIEAYERLIDLRQDLEDTDKNIHLFTITERYNALLMRLDVMREQILYPGNAEQFSINQYLTLGQDIYDLRSLIAEESAILSLVVQKGIAIDGDIAARLSLLRRQIEQINQRLYRFNDQIRESERARFGTEFLSSFAAAMDDMDNSFEKMAEARRSLYASGLLDTTVTLSAPEWQALVEETMQSIDHVAALITRPADLVMREKTQSELYWLIATSILGGLSLLIFVLSYKFQSYRVFEPVENITNVIISFEKQGLLKGGIAGEDIGKMLASIQEKLLRKQKAPNDEISVMANAFSNLLRALEKNIEEKRAIASLLETVNHPFESYEEMLDTFMGTLFSLKWLDLQQNGGVVIVDEKNQVMVLKSSKYASAYLQSLYEEMSLDKGLMNDHRPATINAHPDDTYHHVPILDGEKLIGFIVVEPRHIDNITQESRKFLESAAGVLAGAIMREKVKVELVSALHDVERLNLNINAMLDSLGQALLFFDENGICAPFYSKACSTILDGDPTGRPVAEVLGFSSDKMKTFENWLGIVFNGNSAMDFDDLKELLPDKIIKENDAYIELDYRPLYLYEDHLAGVLLIATDITKEREAQEKMRLLQEEAQKTQSIAQNRNEFYTFIIDLYAFVQRTKELEITHIENGDLEEIKRVLHTFKGQAGMFNLVDLSRLLHSIEDDLGRQNAQSLAQEEIMAKINGLETQLDEEKSYAQTIFGQNFMSQGSTRTITHATSLELKQLVTDINCDEESREALNEFISKHFLSVPVFGLFQPFQREIMRLCELKGKPLPRVELEGDNSAIVLENYGDIFKTMTHLARNIAEHALGNAEERMQQGKPPEGRVRVTVEQTGHDLVISISDDGHGIDPRRIRTMLEQQGRHEEAAESDEDIIYHILDPDFSTNANTSVTSGRGIGMNALYNAVKDVGGDIEIKSNFADSKGTTFIFKLPYKI